MRTNSLFCEFKNHALWSSSRRESILVTSVAQAPSALLDPGVWRRGIGNKAGTCPAHLGCSVLRWPKPPPGAHVRVRALRKLSRSLGDLRTK